MRGAFRVSRGALLFAAATIVGLACRGPRPPTTASADAPPALVAERPDAARAGALEGAPPTPAEAPAFDEEAARRYGKLLCGKRRRCCVADPSDLSFAGRTADGRQLTVVRLDRRCDGRPRPTEPDSESCVPYEYHLVEDRAGQVVHRAFLSAACNNGYGAAGAGEDETSVDPVARTFTHARSGGSAWRWTSQVVLGLDPLRVVSVGRESTWTMEPHETTTTWSWDDFAGIGAREVAFCATGRDGGAAERGGEDQDPDGAEVPTAGATFTLVPRVAVPPAFAAGGWRTTALAGCAAFVDGNEHGATIHGDPGTADDASMRVVASDGVLYIEVKDDHLVGPGRRWLIDDHLELWIRRDNPPYCQPAAIGPDQSPWQWGVRLADGRVFPAFGDPPADALAVEVARAAPGIVRVRIALRGAAAEAESVAIVYSDGDDGKTQERLVATSDVTFGKPWTLGAYHDVPPEAATCVLRAGALVPAVKPLRAAKGRALTDDLL